MHTEWANANPKQFELLEKTAKEAHAAPAFREAWVKSGNPVEALVWGDRKTCHDYAEGMIKLALHYEKQLTARGRTIAPGAAGGAAMSDPEAPGSSEPQPRTALGADFIIPALACGLAVYYLISSVDLVWEAKATGIVIGLVLIALCVAHCARLGLRIADGRRQLQPRRRWSTTTTSTGSGSASPRWSRCIVVTIYWVGATLGLFLLLIGCMRLLGVTRIRTLVGVAFVTAALVHLLLITLLDSKLPRGLL